MNKEIKKMVEQGFAIRKISLHLSLLENEVKQIIQKNGWNLIPEIFTDDKIDYICDLYQQGVSAKSLGEKFSIDKRRVQKWASFKNILRDRASSHRYTEFNQHVFDTIDTSEKAYWLGFLYADAYNCKKTNTVSLSLQVCDLGHLQKLASFLNLPSSKITYTESKEGYKYYTLKMYSKHLCKTLNDKGCPQAKSFIIKYPDWLDKSLTIDFIRGMFDGDGSLCRRETGEWKWSLATTKECGESIQMLILNHLNLIINLRCISKTNNNTYELESNGNERVLKLAEWLYNNCSIDIRLDRKYQKYLDLINQQNNRTFSKKKYKISDLERADVIKKISEGMNINKIATIHDVHQRTITKIKYDDKFLYEKIASVNDQPITAKYVKTLDYNERMALVEPLFNFFRKQGWVYPDNTSNLKKSYLKLCNWNPDLSSTELFNNSSLATDICKFFCHKFYEATEVGQPTMKEIFNDDEKLKYLIKNRLGFDWWDKEDNDETFNISFRMLIQGMRSSRLVPSISIFKPNIAKYMYMKYSNEGDTVYDYSAGWGGRMLGATSSNRKYIGVDPLTIDELTKIVNYYDFKNVQLINCGSENFKLKENSVDFSFSSPPYFNQEYYSSDKTQAYNNGEDYFYNVYWKQTLENIKYMLKPNKYFGLNVLEKYSKMTDMCDQFFGKPKEIIKLRTVRSHLNKNSGIIKYEPIYVYKNNK